MCAGSTQTLSGKRCPLRAQVDVSERPIHIRLVGARLWSRRCRDRSRRQQHGHPKAQLSRKTARRRLRTSLIAATQLEKWRVGRHVYRCVARRIGGREDGYRNQSSVCWCFKPSPGIFNRHAKSRMSSCSSCLTGARPRTWPGRPTSRTRLELSGRLGRSDLRHVRDPAGRAGETAHRHLSRRPSRQPAAGRAPLDPS